MAKDARDWKFFLPCVSKRISEELSCSQDDKILPVFVIFSNQNTKQGILKTDTAERVKFQNKIENVISKLGVDLLCPVLVCFAVGRDIYRKPANGMWEFVVKEKIGARKAVVDLDKSFFVGDAAGRLAGWKTGKNADWSAVDRKFALNVGIKFFSPEEYFLGEEQCRHVDIGRNPVTLVETISSTTTLDISIPSSLEMVIAVGSPASGKSTFYKKKFSHYAHINRDLLKTVAKCKSAARAALAKGQSVYVDNTHPTRESRLEFISIASEMNIPTRCILFVTDDCLSKHLDVFRSITTRVEPLPSVAFHAFHNRYQPPVLQEGFSEIIQIPFVPEFDSAEKKLIFTQYLF